MTPRLSILATGMTSAVGLTAEASCAAIRARLDGFRETRFVATGGEWIIGAEVPLPEPWRGVARLAHLVAGPIKDCLSAIPTSDPATVPVLIATAEQDRPGRLAGLEAGLRHEIEILLGHPLAADSAFVPHGRTGAASAIRYASKLMAEHGHGHVVVAGVDSLLLTDTLASLDATRRLVRPDNSNGFIPGEAGAAILLGAPDPSASIGILSAGFGMEQATMTNEEPLRGEGLRAAFRQALVGAGIEMREVGYRIATVSGEQYFFKEFDLATNRILRGRHAFMDLWHPADCIGETGAASLPACLVVASMAARKGYAAGDPVLIAASNDDSRRAALLLAAQGLA